MTVELMAEPNGTAKEEWVSRLESVVNAPGFTAMEGSAVAPKKTLKVAIIGTCPSSMGLAPYDDPTWEIWGLNTLHSFALPRWDRWFDLHPVEWTKGIQSGKQWEWLCLDHGKTIYMQEQHPDVPHSEKFPLDQLTKRFGGYFTNTVSLMIAFAMLEGAKEIGLYGVDMAQTAEYAAQRPSCEYFIGLARGMGITVHVPDESQLLQAAGIYGYDMSGKVMTKLRSREKELQEKVASFEKQRDTAEANRLVFSGALDNLNWTKQFFNPPG